MNRALKLALSVALTLLFGWWAFRDTDLHQQWASLKAAHYLWLIPYVGVLLVIHLTRTLRWGYLLSGMERVPFRPLNDASAIGFMMLLVLPFRLGEFARPFLIAQRSTLRRSAAMASVVLERIVDGMSIAILLRVLLLFVPTDTPQVRYVKVGANVMFGIFGSGLLFLLFARWHHDRAVRWVRAVAGLVSPKLADKFAGIVETFVGALRQLPAAPQTVGFFLCTALYWALNGFGMSLLSRAFDCVGASGPCQPLMVNLFQGYVVLAVLVVGLMIPAAPGMVGTFQAGIKVGLSLFLPSAVVNSTGLAYANVMWLTQTVQQVTLGLVCMSLGRFSFRDLTGKLNEVSSATATPGA